MKYEGAKNSELVVPRCLTQEIAVDWMIKLLETSGAELVHDVLPK